MVKSEVKSKKDQTQEGISKSYKKLAIVVVVAVSILALTIGAWQDDQTQSQGPQSVEPARPKSAEEVIAERVPRVPPRAPGENPIAGVLTRESAGPGSGVEIKAPAPLPPVKPTQAPLRPPTVEMIAGVVPSKGSAPALAVDAEGYATLPGGQRVKVSPSSAAAPAFAVPMTRPPTVQVEARPQELGQGGPENKKEESAEIFRSQRPMADAEGYALWPNGKRMTLDTKGLPVDADGMVTLTDGKKVKAGETVYIRLTAPEGSTNPAPPKSMPPTTMPVLKSGRVVEVCGPSSNGSATTFVLVLVFIDPSFPTGIKTIYHENKLNVFNEFPTTYLSGRCESGTGAGK